MRDGIVRWIKKLAGGAPSQPDDVDEVATTAPAQGAATTAQPTDGDEPLRWIPADDNPFSVPLLDVRPITTRMIAASSNPVMAQNAASYGGELGASFADDQPACQREVQTTLTLPAPEALVDGAAFTPSAMEDKWALFIYGGELLVVRSWQRKVFLRAALRIENRHLLIGPLRGCLMDESESPEHTTRALEFLLRTHALRQPWPAPIADGATATDRELALACFSSFGRNAQFAARQAPKGGPPPRPLRVRTRLHLAALQDDDAALEAALRDGVPVDLRDGDGNAAVHYAATVSVLERLLAAGADPALPGEAATTPLMLAAQRRKPELVSRLLAAGAPADGVDGRGFSALHRAAEMGEVEIARALLASGADPARASSTGHTPRALAELRGEASVLALFGPPASA